MSGTSPAAAYSSAPLLDNEKADVRRFAGYPTYGGIGQVGFQSWRFFEAYGLLEYRMNNLAPAEYQNVRYYVAELYILESALFSASSTLNVGQAAAFTRNTHEMRERNKLFNDTRRRLAAIVGVPSGPDLQPAGMQLVV